MKVGLLITLKAFLLQLRGIRSAMSIHLVLFVVAPSYLTIARLRQIADEAGSPMTFVEQQTITTLLNWWEANP